MKVINIHQRVIEQPISKVSELFKTLATSDDEIWPYHSWPAMRFRDGLHLGSQGGHGRVRYTIIAFEAGNHIKFQFTKPEGFNGTHELKINAISNDSIQIIHEIRMHTTSLKATFYWVFVIRWLHDALIEDAFDKVENYFSIKKRTTRYNLWVRFLREAYKRKSFQTKHA